MKVNKIFNVTHIQVNDNLEQFYYKNKMVQRFTEGNKITYTTVDLDNGNIIKKFTKYICKLCEDFDCKWCRNEVNK